MQILQSKSIPNPGINILDSGLVQVPFLVHCFMMILITSIVDEWLKVHVVAFVAVFSHGGLFRQEGERECQDAGSIGGIEMTTTNM